MDIKARLRTSTIIWRAASLAIVVGSLIPSAAAAAWTVGEPIVTYWNGQGLHDDATAALDANANFNLTWVRLNGSLGDVDEQLARCSAYNMRALITDELVITPEALDGGEKQAKLDALIDHFKDSPAAYMYFVKDEPYQAEFAGLAPLVEYIHQRDPNHASYINLWPDYYSAGVYENYLSSFVDTVHPEILSYDHYSFMKAGDISWQRGSTLYYQNLVKVRAEAVASGMPFMNIVQACSYYTSVWRNPDAGELRLQAYTTMAYGASGISWFTWCPWVPYGNGDYTQGGLRPAPDGTLTQTYLDVTPINLEFVAIVSKLQGLTSIGGFHKGDQPPGTTRLPSDSPFYLSPDVADTTYVNKLPVKGWVVGLFGDGLDLADAISALVVNLDYDNEKTTTVYGPGNLFVLDTLTGLWTNTHANHVTLTFAPGGGYLISTVPEPTTLVLLGTGLLGLAIYGRRRTT